MLKAGWSTKERTRATFPGALDIACKGGPMHVLCTSVCSTGLVHAKPRKTKYAESRTWLSPLAVALVVCTYRPILTVSLLGTAEKHSCHDKHG